MTRAIAVLAVVAACGGAPKVAPSGVAVVPAVAEPGKQVAAPSGGSHDDLMRELCWKDLAACLDAAERAGARQRTQILVRAATVGESCRYGAAELCVAKAAEWVDRDGNVATALFEEACADGNSAGCLQAGRLYALGFRVVADVDYVMTTNGCFGHVQVSVAEKSAAEAKRLFERGCDMGSQAACAELAP